MRGDKSGQELKVAFFAHYSGIYGANQSLSTLIGGLKSQGVKPVVFLPSRGPMLKHLSTQNVDCEVLPYELWMAPPRGWLLAPLRLWKNWRIRPLIRHRLMALRPDLIHSNSSVLGIGMKVASDLNLPHVWHLREFAKEAFGMRPDLGWRDMHRWLERSPAYIAVSDALKQHLLSPEAQSRCTVIYNGVMNRAQMEELRQRRQDSTDLNNSQFTFLMVGRISPLKGQTEAIAALAQVQAAMSTTTRVQLKLVGGGNEAYIEKLQQLTRQLGISKHVEFTGFINDPFPAYVAADSVLVCSHSEGMGRVTAEAMGVGVPVIGRDTTGTAELIEHEQTGLLYDGQIESLAAAMIRLIEESDLRAALSEGGWKQACEHFTVETYCSRTHELFEQVISRG